MQIYPAHAQSHPGPSCSKLMMSLVNILLKPFLIIRYGTHANIFAEKMRVAFAKLLTFFQQKYL